MGLSIIIITVITLLSIWYSFHLNKKYHEIKKRHRMAYIIFIPAYLALWTLTLYFKLAFEHEKPVDDFLTIFNALSLTIVFIIIQEATSAKVEIESKRERINFDSMFLTRFGEIEQKINDLESQNNKATSEVIKELKSIRKDFKGGRRSRRK